ncbi:hypothetical protein SAMN05216383_10538 [Prevotella sp. KH2C16]|nr:hypothetical protein SAMN05216383_10538 [Prevotella sp. KH2C16]
MIADKVMNNAPLLFRSRSSSTDRQFCKNLSGICIDNGRFKMFCNLQAELSFADTC